MSTKIRFFYHKKDKHGAYAKPSPYSGRYTGLNAVPARSIISSIARQFKMYAYPNAQPDLTRLAQA